MDPQREVAGFPLKNSETCVRGEGRGNFEAGSFLSWGWWWGGPGDSRRDWVSPVRFVLLWSALEPPKLAEVLTP